ncbi:MAG: thermonuclease family protein [Chloroflexi bacterium]|nr:thermonuclease family protein [Chloroflexota bacterium]
MKKLLILLFVVALLVSCVPVTEGQVRVVRVIDGDTIEIAGGERVRYIGIDTPETYPQVEPYGAEAKAKNIELVEGKLVTLERDVSYTDKYDRLLRYVYVDGLFVNGELVRLGYAEAVPYPPDTRYQWQLELLEAEAKAAARGIWSE